MRQSFEEPSALGRPRIDGVIISRSVYVGSYKYLFITSLKPHRDLAISHKSRGLQHGTGAEITENAKSPRRVASHETSNLACREKLKIDIKKQPGKIKGERERM